MERDNLIRCPTQPGSRGIGHSSRSEYAHFLLRDGPCIAKSCDELTSQTGTSRGLAPNISKRCERHDMETKGAWHAKTYTCNVQHGSGCAHSAAHDSLEGAAAIASQFTQPRDGLMGNSTQNRTKTN